MNLTAYQEAKQRHPGMVLLFRIGDYFELFGDDAETAARLLGLTLTTTTQAGKRVPKAGFPHHALEHHLRALIKAGHRVAVCDPEEPVTPKIERTLFDDVADD